MSLRSHILLCISLLSTIIFQIYSQDLPTHLTQLKNAVLQLNQSLRLFPTQYFTQEELRNWAINIDPNEAKKLKTYDELVTFLKKHGLSAPIAFPATQTETTSKAPPPPPGMPPKAPPAPPPPGMPRPSTQPTAPAAPLKIEPLSSTELAALSSDEKNKSDEYLFGLLKIFGQRQSSTSETLFKQVTSALGTLNTSKAKTDGFKLKQSSEILLSNLKEFIETNLKAENLSQEIEKGSIQNTVWNFFVPYFFNPDQFKQDAINYAEVLIINFGGAARKDQKISEDIDPTGQQAKKSDKIFVGIFKIAQNLEDLKKNINRLRINQNYLYFYHLEQDIKTKAETAKEQSEGTQKDAQKQALFEELKKRTQKGVSISAIQKGNGIVELLQMPDKFNINLLTDDYLERYMFQPSRFDDQARNHLDGIVTKTQKEPEKAKQGLKITKKEEKPFDEFLNDTLKNARTMQDIKTSILSIQDKQVPILKDGKKQYINLEINDKAKTLIDSIKKAQKAAQIKQLIVAYSDQTKNALEKIEDQQNELEKLVKFFVENLGDIQNQRLYEKLILYKSNKSEFLQKIIDSILDRINSTERTPNLVKESILTAVKTLKTPELDKELNRLKSYMIPFVVLRVILDTFKTQIEQNKKCDQIFKDLATVFQTLNDKGTTILGTEIAKQINDLLKETGENYMHRLEQPINFLKADELNNFFKSLKDFISQIGLNTITDSFDDFIKTIQLTFSKCILTQIIATLKDLNVGKSVISGLELKGQTQERNISIYGKFRNQLTEIIRRLDTLANKKPFKITNTEIQELKKQLQSSQKKIIQAIEDDIAKNSIELISKDKQTESQEIKKLIVAYFDAINEKIDKNLAEVS